jgi:hypothetical protein
MILATYWVYEIEFLSGEALFTYLGEQLLPFFVPIGLSIPECS